MRGLYARLHRGLSELFAIDLETGEKRQLFSGPFMEMEVAPDRSAVAFCMGTAHSSMGLAELKLEPPSQPHDLPKVLGKPKYVVASQDFWHVHKGGWSPDSKSFVYTRDQDYGDLYELVAKR